MIVLTKRQQEQGKSAFHVLLGQKIGIRRRQLGLKQSELSEFCGLPRSNVSKIEAGWQGTTLVGILMIADALDCEVADLFPTREEMGLK